MSVGDKYESFVFDQSSLRNVEISRVIGEYILCHNVGFISFLDLLFDVQWLQGQSDTKVDLSIDSHLFVVIDFQDGV